MPVALTPVRVRRKRKTPTTTTDEPPALHESSRPHSKVRRSLAIVMEAAKMRPKANLQSLPSEILENILLYSSNVLFPQASHEIGIKLSSMATRVRVVAWAFHDTWDQWFGIPTSKSIFYGPSIPDQVLIPCEGDYTLQSQVLALPWAKIDVLLQAQQLWADRYGPGRWYQHCVPWEDSASKLSHSHEGGHHHFNAKECFEVDYQQALKWAPFRNEKTHWCTQDVHPLARIPSELLTGPWDDEKQRRLFWLSRGGAVIESEYHTSQPWETKLECLRNAVLDVPEPNTLVVNCIMRSWLFQDLPRDIIRKEVANLKKRQSWGDDTADGREILRRTRNAMEMSLYLPDHIKPQ